MVARPAGLGATRVREVNKGPAGHWWIMRGPEGDEFCVAPVRPWSGRGGMPLLLNPGFGG